MNLKIGNINFENSNCEKLPGVKVKNKLKFNEHVDGIIKKASCKLAPYLGVSLSKTWRKNTF